MSIGGSLYKLSFETNANSSLLPTRREMALLKKVTEESVSPTERFNRSLAALDNLFDHSEMTIKQYNYAVDQLTNELPANKAAQEDLRKTLEHGRNALQQMRTPTQDYIDALVMNKKAAAAMGWSNEQLAAANKRVRDSLPEVVAAEKSRAEGMKRAKAIIEQNLSPQEKYRLAVSRLPQELLKSSVGQAAYRNEVARLRATMLGTTPVVSRFASSLGMSRITGMIGSLTGVTLGIAGVGMAARSAFRSYDEFAKGMARSTSIMIGLTSDQQQRMESAARDVSFQVEASAADAARSYFYLTSAALTAEQSIASMPVVAKFAQAGTFDLALATDLLTDAQKSMGLESEDTATHLKNLTHVSDVFTAANIYANANIEQFSEAITSGAGPAAHRFGVTLEDTLSVLQIFANKGFAKGEEAGTQFAIVMRELTNKFVENKDVWMRAGIDVFDPMTGKFNGVSNAIHDMENAMSSMTEEEGVAFLKSLDLQAKSIAGLQTLLGESDEIDSFKEKISEVGGLTEDVADKSMSKLTKTTNALKAGWDEFAGITIPALLEGFDKANKDSGTLVQQIREINAATKENEHVAENAGGVAAHIAQSWKNIGNEIVSAGENLRWFMMKTEDFLGFGNTKLQADPYAANLEIIKTDAIRKQLAASGRLVELDPEVLKRRAAKASVAPIAESIAPTTNDAASATEDLKTAYEDNKSAEDFSESVEKLEKQLQEQIDTFGMSADQLAIWKLSQEAAGDATTATAKALQAELAAMKETEKATDAYTKAFESVMTELENLNKSAAEIEQDRLIKLGVSVDDANVIMTLNEMLDVRKELKDADEEAAKSISKYEEQLRKQIATQGMAEDEIKLWELRQKGALDADIKRIAALQREAAATEELTSAIQSNFDAQKVGERSTLEGLAKARQKQIADSFAAAKSPTAEDAAGSPSTVSPTETFSAPVNLSGDFTWHPPTDLTASVDLEMSRAFEDFQQSLTITPMAAEPIVPQPIAQPVVPQPSEQIKELEKQTKIQERIAKSVSKPVQIVVEEVTL